jgi:hypothetical protein
MNWQHVHKEILEDAAHGPVIAHVNGSKMSAVMAASARQLHQDSCSSSFILWVAKCTCTIAESCGLTILVMRPGREGSDHLAAQLSSTDETCCVCQNIAAVGGRC